METLVAPAGAQNAPGVIIFTLTEGSALCVGVGDTSGTEAISVVPSNLEVEIREFNFCKLF